MAGRDDAWQVVVDGRPVRDDAAGDAGRADQRHAGIGVSGEIVEQHVIDQRVAWIVGTRVGVNIDETRDQPTAVMDHLGIRNTIEAEAIAIEEQHPFLAVGQAPAAEAQRHPPSPSCADSTATSSADLARAIALLNPCTMAVNGPADERWSSSTSWCDVPTA